MMGKAMSSKKQVNIYTGVDYVAQYNGIYIEELTHDSIKLTSFIENAKTIGIYEYDGKINRSESLNNLFKSKLQSLGIDLEEVSIVKVTREKNVYKEVFDISMLDG